MESKIHILYEFLQPLFPAPARRRGHTYTYNWPSMLLFFMVMLLKGIHSYKGMAKYAQVHYQGFGWYKAPCRKTIARRFEALPTVLYWLMPLVAQQANKANQSVFGFRWAFIDKSVFRAKGGVWHRTHRLLGIIPHSSIDTEASWGKSAYHGWRFGYGLHLLSNQHRFPLACTVTTAASKDSTQLIPLLVHFAQHIGVVVADAGYLALAVLRQLLDCWKIFVLLPYRFKAAHLSVWQKEYNLLIQTPQARWLYRQRKPSIEPLFALIKELFHLCGENQLPYKGLTKVKPYLMMASFTVQLMMVYNYCKGVGLASTHLFLTDFK